MVISHGSKHRADAAERLAQTRRFLDDDAGNAADPFRYFLTPNRASPSVTSAHPVRQVAIFSNSVLWFNPIFSHLSERFGTQACALKVSNTGKDADSYPLDYADVAGDSAGPVRIVGISEGLLASTLSQPLLEKIELMVFLMRRSGQGTDTEFVARALSHPVVQRCKPHVLFVTPGGSTALSEMLHKMVADAGLQSTETRGSVLMGGPTWKAIHEQLITMEPPRPRSDQQQAQEPITDVDLMLDPETHEPTMIAPLVPETEIRRAPPQGKKKNTAPKDSSVPERPADLSAPALKDMLERLMHGLHTSAWAGWLDTRAHTFAARTSNAPNAAILKVLAETVSSDINHLTRRGEAMREMISTYSEYHEIMVPHPLDPTLVLYLFARLDDLPLGALRRLILDDLMD
ncbi:hypothetical protein [Diaphorobacter aerolatus]|uniref:Uncharacterized protein n=1 Tax=Diaphorobacter aerolatus TaxID=1288495 RepID=A0A7H0GMY4_9BURK|nr:hypothetical protein [Diaphorobacter aerolatus]QNP49650.1 hypothetical protein H9K75_06775 [Diaphorobacter aerolatus]